MIIITSGYKTSDIDILACALAYQELLNLQGDKALTVLPGVFTESISKTVKNWDMPYVKEVPLTVDLKKTDFVIVDVSIPETFPQFVDHDRILKIFDHHFYGFEKFWYDKLGQNAIIEPVGSCASLIFEQWEKARLLNKMSQLSINLLYTAIISNSLNLQATITTDKDRKAAKYLKEKISLGLDWVAQYYKEIEVKVMKEPVVAINNDTYSIKVADTTWAIGQLELWKSYEFLVKNKEDLLRSLSLHKIKLGFITCPSISEGCNHILALNNASEEFLADLLGLNFKDSLAKTKKLFLRKELIKMLYQEDRD